MKILEVPGASIDDTIIDDPLLGPAHVITSGEANTTMSAIDWSRPTLIPTVAAPARLAPGAGGAIMNAIATRARDAGVPALRYAGRYPTAALFRTLLRSFRTTATEDDFASHFSFTRHGEIPIDFVPAPFTRIDNPHGHVELRDGHIERAVIDRVSYEVGGSPARLVEHAVIDRVSYEVGGSPARLIEHAHEPTAIIEQPVVESESNTQRVRAMVWFGDAPYADVATFTTDGGLVEGPHPIPPCTSDVIGKPFPSQLVDALAELVADAVPAPLREDARRYLTEQTIRWADLGAKSAAMSDSRTLSSGKGSDPVSGFDVHAAIWDRIAPLGYPRLALALAEALAPVVTTSLVAKIAMISA